MAFPWQAAATVVAPIVSSAFGGGSGTASDTTRFNWQKKLDREARDSASAERRVANAFNAEQARLARLHDAAMIERSAYHSRKGQYIGMRFAGREARKAREFTTAERVAAQEHALELDNTLLQRRVADAVAAGVHPLFALGASANYSPVFSTAGAPGAPGPGGVTTGSAGQAQAAQFSAPSGQAPSGSFAESGLATFGDALVQAARLLETDPVDKARIAALNAQAANDMASALYTDSQMKRAAASANHHRSPPSITDPSSRVRKPAPSPGKSYIDWPMGIGRVPQGPSTPADEVETGYGEGGGIIYGIMRQIEDLGVEMWRRTQGARSMLNYARGGSR